MAGSEARSLLSVQGLRTYFFTERGVLRAVDNVSFSIQPGSVLSIVGESGCGKTVTALSIVRLIPAPPGRIVGGEIIFNGRNLLTLDDCEMRKIRGNLISMIFQEPRTSLNPIYRVGDQIAEVLRVHRGLRKKEAWKQAVELLAKVGIPSAKIRANDYPHQMSGGMCQRVMIAMAIACNPSLIIADEPTTALDVTIQAQILEILEELRRSKGISILLITHDLGVVAEIADNVIVMYAGHIVEAARVGDIFNTPLHPYTKGLLGSIPGWGEQKLRLEAIEGVVPSLFELTPGCRFNDRCRYSMARCSKEEPPLLQLQENHFVRCWLYREGTPL